MNAKLAGSSQEARGSTKGNEDRWRAGNALDNAVYAVVADGVTQPRSQGGEYPEGAADAAQMCVDRFSTVLSTSPRRDIPMVRDAVVSTTEDLYRYNLGRDRWNIPDWRFADRIGTTFIASRLHPSHGGGMEGVVSFIGDPVGLLIGPVNVVQMVSRDQLAPVHRLRDRFPSNEERLAYQRGMVCNNKRAMYQGVEGIGYGVLNGHQHALHFVEHRRVIVPRGWRLLLASDALRICSTVDDPDDARGYEGLADMVRGIPDNDNVPSAVIAMIRTEEETRGVRSDDATVVSIEGA